MTRVLFRVRNRPPHENISRRHINLWPDSSNYTSRFVSRPNLSQKFRRSFKCLESSSIPARDRATVKTTQTIIARIPAGCFPQFPTPSSSRRQRPRPTTLWLLQPHHLSRRLSRELAGAGSRLSSGHAPLCSWRSACSGLIAEPVRAAIGTFGGIASTHEVPVGVRGTCSIASVAFAHADRSHD